MYKGTSNFSHRQTRTEATILQNDRPTKGKARKHKALQPLNKILKGVEESKEKIESLAMQPCPFILQGDVPKTVTEVYALIRQLDRMRIRHPKAVSQQLEKAGIINIEGKALKNAEVQELISFLNKSCSV